MPPTPNDSVRTDQIARALRVYRQPGEVVEIRSLKVQGTYGKPKTWSGYFDDIEIAARVARDIDNLEHQGVFFTVQRINPALLARRSNRLSEAGDVPTTSDHDVFAYAWLPIDLDPIRPSGISATDQEKECSRARKDALVAMLRGYGWPEPVISDSGNGFHVDYQIDLPVEDKELVKRTVEALSFRFSNGTVKIDTSVHNPARIWKLPGTTTKKGENAADRPHRVSRLESIPTPLVPVTRDQLLAVSEWLPTDPKPTRANLTQLDLDSWLETYLPDVSNPREWNGGQLWTLPTCPFPAAHSDGNAYVVRFPSGGIVAGCHHDSCHGLGWREMRMALEPGSTDPDGSNREQEHRSADRLGKERKSSPSWMPMSDVEPEEVEWLAVPRIPLGKFTIIEGDPGTFKSHITLSLAAAVSTGGLAHSTMPGWQPSEPANVLVLTAEDGLGDTVRPRLDMLGADTERVHVMTPSTSVDFLLDEQGFSQLREAIETYEPRLVIIDPLVAYFGGDIDMHRANEVRQVTKRLAALAEEFSCAIVGVRHLAKSATTKGQYRGMGSIDLTAAARSVLLAGNAPQTDQYALVVIKSSLAAKAPALTYEHDGDSFTWGEECALTAGDLFASDTVSDAWSKLDQAAEWLKQTLRQQGPLAEMIVTAQAENAGFSKSTTKRAKPKAGVVAEPVRVAGKAGIAYWLWRLEDQGQPATEPSHSYEEFRSSTIPTSELGLLNPDDVLTIPVGGSE